MRGESKDSSQERADERLDLRTYSSSDECKRHFEAKMVSFSQLPGEAELKVIGREVIGGRSGLYLLNLW